MDSRSPFGAGDKLRGNSPHQLSGGLRPPVKPDDRLWFCRLVIDFP